MNRYTIRKVIFFCAMVSCIHVFAESNSRQVFLEHFRERAAHGVTLPQFCLSPGATIEDVAYVDDILALSAPLNRFNGTDGTRWKKTATDGGGIVRGQPITLTWSIVPDGLNLAGGNSYSNLKSEFDAGFGSRSTWVSLLTEVFEEWTAKTGITFIKVGDDGAPFPSSIGQIGQRGDIRIGGFSIDGSGSGVLAYNYFPEGGDMVLDTANTGDTFKKPKDNFRYFRNVVSHELGHGLGFDHVCPIDETKIMEPFITRVIDHSAIDDIANGNRKYGDPYEKGSRNDIVTNATPLGAVSNIDLGNGSDPSRQIASLDAVTDVDFYAITLNAGAQVSSLLTPLGEAYLFGDDKGKGCENVQGSLLVAGSVINLNVQLIAPDGFTVLEQADVRGAGKDEFFLSDPIASTGTYFLRVYTNDLVATLDDDKVQLYTLAIRVPGEDLSEIPVSGALACIILSLILALLGWQRLHKSVVLGPRN